MKLEVTRDVVSDLWPLAASGEASTDSRAIVDAFLAADPELAARLRASEQVGGQVPQVRLSPEAERRLIDEAGRRARTRLLVVGGLVAFGGVILLVALLGALFMVVRMG